MKNDNDKDVLNTLFKMNNKFASAVEFIKNTIEERYKVSEFTVYYDEFSFDHSYIKFSMPYNFHYMIELGEIEFICEKNENLEHYVNMLCESIDIDFLDNIKRTRT